MEHGTDMGVTPLCTAAYHGELEVVQWLLTSGAELEHASLSGRTPFYCACMGGHVEIVRLFLCPFLVTLQALPEIRCDET